MADDPLSGLSNINIDNIYELGSIIGKIKIDLFESKDNAEKFRLATEDHSSFARSLATEFTKSKNFLEDSLNLANRLGTSYVKIDDVTKQIKRNLSMGDEIKKQIERTQELFKAQDKRKSLTKAIQSFENGINTLSGQALEKHIKSADKYVVQLHTLGKILNSVDQVDKILQHLANNVESANDQFDKSNIKASALKRVLSSISNIPIIGPLLDWQRMSDKIFGPNGNARKGMMELTSQIKKLYEEPLVKGLLGGFILKKLFDSFVAIIKVMAEVNKSTTALSNNIGMSNEAGKALYNVFYETSGIIMRNSDSLVKGLDVSFLSIRNMTAATLSLQESLGTSAMFTNKMVQSQIFMTKQMKMSTEEAAGFQRLSLLSGKSVDAILQSSIKQNVADDKRFISGISYRKILKEISTISAELSMRYANDPEQIAKAVVQANKLGMSLEDTRKIASSLLNFEQSIEGELESELLLGRQFNFEKARELALMGKSAEAAGELLGQIGGINALEKMNVIQRERVAAAIGLSSDELSKAAIEQEVLNKLGAENEAALKEKVRILQAANNTAGLAALQEEAAKIRGGEVLLQDIAKANIAEKYEETMNRIKDILTVLVSNSGTLKAVFIGIAAIATAFAASMVTAAIASVMASSAISGGALGGIAIGSGLIAAALLGGAMNVVSVGDFQRSPEGTVIMSPEGTFRPSKRDYITASTNPPFQGGGSDNSAVTAKLDELIGEVRKGGNVYIDSTRSGTAYGMSYNSYA